MRHHCLSTAKEWMSTVPGARFAGVAGVGITPFFMARGTTEAARLGATWRCRVMFSVRVAETATFGGVALIHLAVAGKAR